jgi:UDP-glucose 4-epimerase
VKYFITGGAGFIGSHLADSLISRGDQVLAFDNLSTGSLGNLVQSSNKLKFENGSILDEVAVDSCVAESDFVVHLAAALGVFNIINKPLESLKTNINGTEIVLEAANRYKKPILIASTSEIYGKNKKVPLNEEDDRVIGHPLKSRWSYSEAKAVDESLAFFYYQKTKLPVRIVRLFNTVGPRQIGDYGMVLPRFVSSALKNKPLNVYGDGEQIRCFCHIRDTIRALLLVMDSDKSIGQVFNIGNDEQVTIRDLARRVIEITASKSSIINIPYEEAYVAGFEDMRNRVPDISKIRNELGWQPEFTLNQIIKDIVAFNPD